MTPLARLRRTIVNRIDPFPGVPSAELRRLYWEQRTLAEAAAFDGYLGTSREYHHAAARYLAGLKRRGETISPSPTPDDGGAEERRPSDSVSFTVTRRPSAPAI